MPLSERRCNECGSRIVWGAPVWESWDGQAVYCCICLFDRAAMALG